MYLSFPASSLLAGLYLAANVGLEPCLVQLSLCHRVILAEDVHQVRDVARRQPQRLHSTITSALYCYYYYYYTSYYYYCNRFTALCPGLPR